MNIAVSIIEKVKNEGANSEGDLPSTAATAAYLSCQAENEKLTQDEVEKAFRVTSATIRNNARKLNKFIKTENLERF